LFIEETGARSKVFDFSRLPVRDGVREWLARGFARMTGPRAGAKRLATAESYARIVRLFAAFLAESGQPVTGPADITSVRIRAFWLANTGSRWLLETLRAFLRDDPELPERSRAALLSLTLPPAPPGSVVGYGDEELRSIMTALRRDIRRARDRITEGRALLHRYRQHPDRLGESQRQAGGFLDELDRGGVLPRRSERNLSHAVAAAGGAQRLCSQLCLTYMEAVAFGLLLTAVTGQNLGTVIAWPALHYRPDGGDDTAGIALLETVKPRRGPDREHMITSLEDVPDSLSAVLVAGDSVDRHLFRSPLRIYRLLLDLSSLARAHGGHASAFCYVSPRTRTMPDWWRGGLGPGAVHKWAKARGFATGRDDPELRISAWALRQTVLERKGTPIAHSVQVMNDRYLGRSETAQAGSRKLITAALGEQVHAARERISIPVIPASLIARAAHDPQAAAAEAGLSPEVMTGLVGGRLDTVAAGCVDNTAGPGTPPGQPCRESFLGCLDCPNSRALPHHLPVQIAVRERLGNLRDNLPPAQWDARRDRAHSQLGDIIGHYTAAEKDNARTQLTASQEKLADDLVHGRLDLR
jgi:type II secretory pathway component PulJ